MTPEASAAVGVYGFRLDGAVATADWVVPAEPDWPLLTVIAEPGSAAGDAPEPGTQSIGPDRAEFWMRDGDVIRVERDPLTVRFRTRVPLSSDALAHPYLGPPSIIASSWLGREVFHGGAFLADGRAWGVLGDKAAGKSSTLGELLRRGHGIVTDDLLILDGRRLYPGPRTVDLRADPARRFGGAELGRVGARERWRLRPPPLPPAVELAGFFWLAWGDEIDVAPLGADDRLRGLAASRAFVPQNSVALTLLELAQLPCWRVTRPKQLETIEDATSELLRVLR